MHQRLQFSNHYARGDYRQGDPRDVVPVRQTGAEVTATFWAKLAGHPGVGYASPSPCRLRNFGGNPGTFEVGVGQRLGLGGLSQFLFSPNSRLISFFFHVSSSAMICASEFVISNTET